MDSAGLTALASDRIPLLPGSAAGPCDDGGGGSLLLRSAVSLTRTRRAPHFSVAGGDWRGGRVNRRVGDVSQGEFRDQHVPATATVAPARSPAISCEQNTWSASFCRGRWRGGASLTDEDASGGPRAYAYVRREVREIEAVASWRRCPGPGARPG